MSTPSGCAAVRQAHAEPLHATAPERAASWLVLEHPGPWPATGFPSDLPAEALAMLAAAGEAGVRPQLVRPVRARRRDAATVLLASCRPGHGWLERRTLRDLRALADLDVAALAAGDRPGFGAAAVDPVVLVCTHGRRDVCCARLGRPLAVLLDRALPGQVWETTHVGGDRFAPNVVALPDGSYHGGLTAADVPALADALTCGQVLRTHLRGRAGLPFPVQAADHAVREQLGLDALAAVTPVACTPGPAGEVCVELLAAGGRWCVHVRSSRADTARLTSCAGDGTVDHPTSYAVARVARLA